MSFVFRLFMLWLVSVFTGDFWGIIGAYAYIVFQGGLFSWEEGVYL